MPIHDWTRVSAGTFHNFHQLWIARLCETLNAGILPSGYYAMVDQRVRGPVPDVVARDDRPPADRTGRPGVAVADAPPTARFMTESRSDARLYARRANRIKVRDGENNVVAVMEVVSPGNKTGRRAFRNLVNKSVRLLDRGINLLVVDLFPPTRRDPHGVHKAIWDEIQDEPFELPANKSLICASYAAGVPIRAFVDALAVGDSLPAAALFLSPEHYVPAPLEESYVATWNALPKQIRSDLE